MQLPRTLLALVTGIFIAFTSNPAYPKVQHDSRILIDYLLKVDSMDLSGYDIEIHLGNAPGHFQLAMATHHEYDDRFWRFLRNFKVETTSHLEG